MTAIAPRWAGLLFVVVLHGAALWGLWQHRLLPSSHEIEAMFVHFIAPPAPEKTEKPKQPVPPKPRAVEKPLPRQLAVEASRILPTDYVASLPPRPDPVMEPPPMALPAGPVTLGSELALSCRTRTPPVYPAASRRLREVGTVVLRVELDEQGLVAGTRVEASSGFESLDYAAQLAVKVWRCEPPRRNGQPVRAVARQPFHFVLQGT